MRGQNLEGIQHQPQVLLVHHASVQAHCSLHSVVAAPHCTHHSLHLHGRQQASSSDAAGGTGKGTEQAIHATQLSCKAMFRFEARLCEHCVAGSTMLDTVIEVLEMVQDCSSYSLKTHDTAPRMGTPRALLCTVCWPETRAVSSIPIE